MAGTAEILRERESDAPRALTPVNDAALALAPPLPTPGGGMTLGSLAQRAFVTGPETIGSMIEAKGAAQRPAIEATRETLRSPLPNDESVRAAEQRVRDVAAQQPPRGFRAFLAPVDGEDPLASIQKLVQALGLFAGGIGLRGSAHGAARGSVAALTGALAGWNAGDKERGDRMFADWKAKSQSALDAWAVESAAYTRALTQRGLTLDERAKEIALIAAEHDNPIMAEKVRNEGAMAALDYVTKREDIAAKYAQAHAALVNSNEQRERDRELRREIAERHEALVREGREQKAAAEKEKRAELEAAYTPEVIRPLAITYATKGTLPPNIARGSSGQFLIPKITADAIAWAKENGIDPNTFPALQAEIKSAGMALTKLRGANAVQEAAIRRFDGHLDKLIELSEQVPRGQRPVANEYILKGRKDWQGDPATAAYILQGLEVGMELARVFVGTAQGDANTREEARKAFAAGSTHEQLKTIVDTLRSNAHRNLEMNRESEKSALSVIDAAMKGGAKPGTDVLRRSDTRYKTLRARGMSDEQITKTYSVILAD